MYSSDEDEDECSADLNAGGSQYNPSGGLRYEIECALRSCAFSGSVSLSGSAADFLPSAPGLTIDGAPVALPLVEGTAGLAAVLAAGTAAAHGRGEETVFDPSVRSTTHVPASRVAFTNPLWADGIRRLTDEEVAVGLGLPTSCGSLVAQAYDLLIYRKGDHFAAMHTDTEKQPGMVATLVVQLPSRCSGGGLVVRHTASHEARHDFGQSQATAEYQCHYAAHYADVDHRVEMVDDGVRVAMVYNLVWEARATSADGGVPPTSEAAGRADDLVAVLKTWEKRGPIAVTLRHAYTAQSMAGSPCLKGTDANVMRLLRDANRLLEEQTGSGLDWVLASIEQTVTTCGYGDRYPGPVVATPQPGLSNLPIPIAALTPFTLDPSEDFAYYTCEELFWHNRTIQVRPAGNEGISVETKYHQSAVLIWPAVTEKSVLTTGATKRAARVFLVMRKESKLSKRGLELYCSSAVMFMDFLATLYIRKADRYKVVKLAFGDRKLSAFLGELGVLELLMPKANIPETGCWTLAWMMDMLCQDTGIMTDVLGDADGWEEVLYLLGKEKKRPAHNRRSKVQASVKWRAKVFLVAWTASVLIEEGKERLWPRVAYIFKYPSLPDPIVKKLLSLCYDYGYRSMGCATPLQLMEAVLATEPWSAALRLLQHRNLKGGDAHGVATDAAWFFHNPVALRKIHGAVADGWLRAYSGSGANWEASMRRLAEKDNLKKYASLDEPDSPRSWEEVFKQRLQATFMAKIREAEVEQQEAEG